MCGGLPTTTWGSRIAVIDGPFITLPNLISLSRIPLAAAAVASYAADDRIAAQVLMLASFFTDALDGAVARLTGTSSQWGRVLDPLADKLVFAILAVFFAAVSVIPWWLVGVLVGRDVLVAIFAFFYFTDLGDVPASNVLGKLSTIAVAVYLFKQAFWPSPAILAGLDALGWVAVAGLVASSIAYGLRFHRLRGERPAVISRLAR